MRLIDHLKAKGTTAFLTALNVGGGFQEASDVGISSLIDTWLLLRDIELSGERNRGLFILKSRGMAHSNQIREFVLTSHGIELREVYLGPAGVLTGSARVVQEARGHGRGRGAAAAARARAPRSRAGARDHGGAHRGPAVGVREEGGRARARDRGGRRDRGDAGRGPPQAGEQPPGRHGTPGGWPAGHGPRAEDTTMTRSKPPGPGRSDYDPDVWELRLYVAGQTPRSITAFANLKTLCEEHLAGRYTIEVIDLLENPQLADGRPDPRDTDAGPQAPRAGAQDHRRPVQHRAGAGRARPAPPAGG